ncbi:energy-coupling factor transporter transmembrane component T family protein [Cuniculiplasma divulgatum]|jgi:energy-coupling factor transport system permease protein|uniref:ABC transporter permease n=1 Tax=Cuniculiplasma divulgatum TaxID=1673428 RepID=A0A1N5VW48_9ARCH|nr:energy-coupling factor transporter transmembrane component T [Cuniculiplasma divulgatum]WMT49666.1 MAG: energy-coupling factor transporter transmembrane component T [Thermoplasmatales archaeon]SIM77178.1 ABC transporter permease [Cuniculiplasma divulgatum]
MYSILDSVISWLLFIFGISIPFYLILGAIGISGFKEITSYENYHTFYYRVNAAVKIVLSVIIVMVATFSIWWIGAIITFGFLGSYVTLKNGWRKLYLAGFLVLSVIIGTVWGYAPYEPFYIVSMALHTPINHFTTIWTWPSYFSILGYEHTLTLQSLYYSFQISFRFTAAIVASLLLVMTNTPAQIVKTLSKLKIPSPIIFSLVVAMKTIPSVFDSFDTSIKISLMRGYGGNRGKTLRPFITLAAAIYSIVPTIVHLLRGAKDIGISADTRAFRAYPTRSYLISMPFRREDYIFSAFLVIIVVGTIIAILMGFGRAIPYLT